MDPMAEGASWLHAELAACEFADARLGQRLRRLLAPRGANLPLACQDWAATKAAYRFFDNARVSEAAILAGHFQATTSSSVTDLSQGEQLPVTRRVAPGRVQIDVEMVFRDVDAGNLW